MQYLGGKYRIAKQLRTAMEPYIQAHGHLVWEPFCGGLNFSRMLTDCRGLLSDVHPALISLYLGYRAGWRPPLVVSRDVWGRAKELPDSDPLKAFIGFGSSFFGAYFRSYLGERTCMTPKGSPLAKPHHINPPRAAADSLRVLDYLSGFTFVRGDFTEPDPIPTECLIYCDPPYLGTIGYPGTPTFDHQLFWGRCQEWARYTTVLVSEQVCPVPHDLVWSTSLIRTAQRKRANSAERKVTAEYLFRVLPVPTPTVFDLCPAPVR